MAMTEFSDDELLDLFANEEKRNYAFNLLVRQYQERLYWHIRRMVIDHDDADDVIQNTFIKVWKGLSKFNRDSKLYTWLYRIATNEALTFLKQRKARQGVNMESVEHSLSNSLEDDNYFEGEAIQKKLQKAILTLPEKQRIVFNMKYFEEMQYQEMSEILETSVGGLKASYHHAVKKIEDYITKH